MEKYSDPDCHDTKIVVAKGHLVSDTQVCNQQGLIGFAEHKEAETQNITSLPPVSQLFENAERQVCRHNLIGCIHDLADL